ncbi:uncharacterized protein LOC141655106 [Silene latifolia]|uniref:uncharacterized protein LOC141655106 n=1 Tax=Silene latifolia TaxID=37657 RepID=UPI003D76DBE8
MDRKLYDAAEEGNVMFLKEAFAVKPSEYFLAHFLDLGNIFHVATWNRKVEFLKEAMNILPKDMQKQLLFELTRVDGYTMLHVAALHRDVSVVKFIKEMYASLWGDDEDHEKPWLALTRFDDENTPLNFALERTEPDENVVMEILLMDPELVSCTIADKHGNTPLYYALKIGFNTVAENILMSPLPLTSIIGSTSFSSLVSLATNCSGNIVRLLWEKYSGCLQERRSTPLHSALHSMSTQELALKTLSTDPALCMICNDMGESPFFLAVRSGCEQVVDKIIRIAEPRFYMLRRNDGTTSILNAEKTGLMLLEKYWWVMNLRDDQGKTALDYAKQESTDWLVKLLTNPSLIKKQDFDWMEACERQESDAVLAFIDHCQDLQRVCRKGKDTILHHVRLPAYKDYIKFLKIQSIAELKNTIDPNGSTPLHCALRREDIHFARALLCDDGVNRIIQDHHGTTSMDLLAKLCKENNDWESMCKEIKVNPYLRTTYILPGTNLEQMRTTLSVIAALLATITFAAGFTLPGGINNDNGQALLGKKAAFLVFLLADAYAMCTSMLVLFCLVWSMVSKHGMARLLVDRSVFILMQSLYATLLVFVTGIYVVIEHTSLWAAIVIFVMCSLIGITSNRTILHWVIAMFVPAAYREKLDEMRLLEEGNAGAFTTEEDNRNRRE